MLSVWWGIEGHAFRNNFAVTENLNGLLCQPKMSNWNPYGRGKHNARWRTRGHFVVRRDCNIGHNQQEYGRHQKEYARHQKEYAW